MVQHPVGQLCGLQLPPPSGQEEPVQVAPQVPLVVLHVCEPVQAAQVAPTVPHWSEFWLA